MPNFIDKIQKKYFQPSIDSKETEARNALYKAIQQKYQYLPVHERNAIFEKWTKETLLYSTDTYPFTSGNVKDPGAFNAFTHAYSAAKMTRDYGRGITAIFAHGKEFGSYIREDRRAFMDGNIPIMNLNELDHNRDWHNNFYGIGSVKWKDKYSDDQIARMILDGMERGELITDLKDPHRRVGLPKFWVKENVYDLVQRREDEYFNKKYSPSPITLEGGIKRMFFLLKQPIRFLNYKN